MATTSRYFNFNGQNSNWEAPPYLLHDTVAASSTADIKLMNRAQYLKVHNHGPAVIRVGFFNDTALGVDGICYYEVGVDGDFDFPCEFDRVYFKNPHGSNAAELSIAITLSPKLGSTAQLSAAGQFDGTEECAKATNFS